MGDFIGSFWFFVIMIVVLLALVLAEHARTQLGSGRTSPAIIARWASESSSPTARRQISYWVAQTLLARREPAMAYAIATEALAAPATRGNSELRWRLPDEAPQRSGQVRLVEIAGLVNGVADCYALLQEDRRISGALDLTHRTLCQPGRSQEMALCGAYGQVCQLAVQCGIYDRLTHEQTAAHEPVDKRVRILEIRELPRRTL